MDDIQRMMAEFAARGGAVKKVAPTEGLHLSRRQWKELSMATKDERPAILNPQQSRDDEDDQRITVVTDHLGREFYKNAEGEWL